MADKTDVPLKKYELIIKNMEFLDSWVMKITGIYSALIIAVLIKAEMIGRPKGAFFFFILALLIIAALV